MIVLIAKQNEDLVNKIFKRKLEFEESTQNTCTFKVSRSEFEKAVKLLRAKGINPYTLMTW